MMEVRKKWLNRLADPIKSLAGDTVETLSAIVASVVSAILSFLGKGAGFVTYMGFGCFCCRLHCVMVNAKTNGEFTHLSLSADS